MFLRAVGLWLVFFSPWSEAVGARPRCIEDIATPGRWLMLIEKGVEYDIADFNEEQGLAFLIRVAELHLPIRVNTHAPQLGGGKRPFYIGRIATRTGTPLATSRLSGLMVVSDGPVNPSDTDVTVYTPFQIGITLLDLPRLATDLSVLLPVDPLLSSASEYVPHAAGAAPPDLPDLPLPRDATAAEDHMALGDAEARRIAGDQLYFNRASGWKVLESLHAWGLRGARLAAYGALAGKTWLAIRDDVLKGGTPGWILAAGGRKKD